MHNLLHAPAILFIIFVVPLWLTLHYRYKSRTSVGLSEEQHTGIDNMLEQMDKLSDRISTLEEILNDQLKEREYKNTESNRSGETHER